MGSILVVPSGLDTCERWSAEIRRAGHNVSLALTWREAYRRVVNGGIDAVVIDSFDPRIGFEQLARSISGRRGAPPIVLVSSSPSAARISAEIGASVFLPKPCDVHALIDVINQLAGATDTNDDFKKEDPTQEFQLKVG